MRDLSEDYFGLSINYGDAKNPGQGNGEMNVILSKEEQKELHRLLMKLVYSNNFLTLTYSVVMKSGQNISLYEYLNQGGS